MAAANSCRRQPTTGKGAATTHCFQGVLRATRLEPACAARAKKERLRRGERPAIKLHRCYQDPLRWVHVLPASLSRLAFRSVANRSLSTWASLFPAIDGRATSTKSTGLPISCWWMRKASRSNRRARVRKTAPPIFFEVTTPNRDTPSAGVGCQFAIKQPCVRRCPCWRTRMKSRPCLMRAAHLNRNRCAGSSAVGCSSSARLRVARFTLQHPANSALQCVRRVSGACVPPDGGCAEWPCRSCWSCDSGIRAAVCGGSSMVDTVAS
jgi:hypothetical protein